MLLVGHRGHSGWLRRCLVFFLLCLASELKTGWPQGSGRYRAVKDGIGVCFQQGGAGGRAALAYLLWVQA